MFPLSLRTSESDENFDHPNVGTVLSPSKHNVVFQDAFHGKRNLNKTKCL